MIKNFKFFQQSGKPIFQTEILNRININDPGSGMCWTREYSDVIRHWISELFFTNTYTNVNLHFKYIHEIDRSCELMATPRIRQRQTNCPLFCAEVKIWKSNEQWMILHLAYPMDHIIYR